MQINDNHKKVGGWTLRVLILVICGWFIWREIGEKWQFDGEFAFFQIQIIAVVMALMPVNWGLEVFRWKISLSSIEPVSWKEAASQVFVGLALNWVLPFTSGDLTARLIPNRDKKRVSVLIVYNRGVMLLLTLILGVYGIFRFSHSIATDYSEALSIGLLSAFLVIVVIGIKTKKIPIRTWEWLFPVTVISFIRYLIFTVQFLLLLHAFNLELSMGILIGGVGWVFLFRSIIPSLFGNLGVREVGALTFFESYVADPSMILIPSLLLWLINTVAPSIFGLHYILKFRK